jgi:hypothetical protein
MGKNSLCLQLCSSMSSMTSSVRQFSTTGLSTFQGRQAGGMSWISSRNTSTSGSKSFSTARTLLLTLTSSKMLPSTSQDFPTFAQCLRTLLESQPQLAITTSQARLETILHLPLSRRYSGRDPILPFSLLAPYLPSSCCSDTSSRPPLGATSARLCATHSIQRSSLIVALSSRVAIHSPRIVDSYCFSLSRPYPSLPRTCRVLPFLCSS